MLNCSTQLAQSGFGRPAVAGVVSVGAVVVSPVAEIEELGDDADGADGDPRFQERQGLPRPDI
jgi:hypothetical protein